MVSKFIEVAGFKIHYLVGGKGKPVVLLPSFGLTSKSYRQFGEKLSLKYQVFIPDLGRGKFSGRLLNSLVEYVSLLDNFVIKIGIGKFCLIGASLSGLIAVDYSQKYTSKIKGLFLTSTTVVPTEGNTFLTVAAWLRMIFNNLFLTKGINVNLLWLTDGFSFLMKNPKQLLKEAAIAVNNINFKKEPTNLKVSHVLVIGNKDEFFPPEVINRMRRIKGLNLEVVDGNHAWFSLKPEVFLEKVENFFGGINKEK